MDFAEDMPECSRVPELDRIIDLGRKGITIYDEPVPTPDLFRPVTDKERLEQAGL